MCTDGYKHEITSLLEKQGWEVGMGITSRTCGDIRELIDAMIYVGAYRSVYDTYNNPNSQYYGLSDVDCTLEEFMNQTDEIYQKRRWEAEEISVDTDPIKYLTSQGFTTNREPVSQLNMHRLLHIAYIEESLKDELGKTIMWAHDRPDIQWALGGYNYYYKHLVQTFVLIIRYLMVLKTKNAAFVRKLRCKRLDCSGHFVGVRDYHHIVELRLKLYADGNGVHIESLDRKGRKLEEWTFDGGEVRIIPFTI